MANNHMKKEDFLILWSQKVGLNTSPNTMQKYLNGLAELILEELRLSGEIYIPNIGTIFIRQTGGRTTKMGDPINGGVVHRFIAPKLQPSFRASGVFERSINENDFKLIKQNYRKKKYSNKEYNVVRNEKRRKPKKDIKEAFCDLLNESEKKNDKTEV